MPRAGSARGDRARRRAPLSTCARPTAASASKSTPIRMAPRGRLL